MILENVKTSINNNLNSFKDMSQDEIINQRKNKFLKIGRGKGFISKPDKLTALKFQSRKLDEFLKSKKFLLLTTLTVVILVLATFLIL